MQTHSISIERTVRICTHGQLHAGTRKIWLITHGYGMLAKYFIKKFEVLDPEIHYVIVPEAFSRFYLEGFTGKIGATWMTSEDRIADISDYIAYLNKVHDLFIPKTSDNNFEIIALGFSQGANTIARWANANPEKFDRLVIWGGSIPEDVLDNHHLTKKHIDICLGNKDPFVPMDKVEDFLFKSKSTLPGIEIHLYDGGHQIDEALLKKIAEASL